MAGIVSSYEIGGRDYLHYYAINANTALSPLYAKINRTKAQIMTGQKNSLNARLKNATKAMTDAGMKLKDAEDLLSGEAFKKLGDIGLTGDVARTFPETSEEAKAIIEKSIAEVDDVQEFVTLLENYVLNYFKTNDYQELYENYAAAIVENFAQSKQRMAGEKSVANAIIRSIIGRYNESFFQMQGKSMNIPTDIAKMLALISSLPNPSNSGETATMSNTYNIRHNKSSDVTGTATGEGEISQVLLGKAQRWVIQMQKIASEAAAAQAMQTGTQKLNKALAGVNKSFEITGNKNFDTHFKPDPKQESLLSETSGLNRATAKKRAKSDVSLYIGENQVVAQVGFSVKDYKPTTSDGSTPAYTIGLQKETPLLTALMREAGISGKDLHNIYQLAVAQGQENVLNYQWDQMVQYAAYRMFLNAAMGFANTVDQSYFIVLNGGIYTIGDVLNNIMSNESSTVLISEYVNNKNAGTGGLIRETYRQMNEDLWQGERYKPNRALAYSRSQMLEPAVSNMMYMTKIRIDIKISELAALAKNL